MPYDLPGLKTISNVSNIVNVSISNVTREIEIDADASISVCAEEMHRYKQKFANVKLRETDVALKISSQGR